MRMRLLDLVNDDDDKQHKHAILSSFRTCGPKEQENQTAIVLNFLTWLLVNSHQPNDRTTNFVNRNSDER